jgi:type III secretory pathway component EscR
MRVVVPAYILSELKAGFAIGAVLFLPFLLIDMVTASITTSIGMFQLPPVVVSTPLEDSAVCDGGRLEPAGQLAVEEFLKGG